MKCSNQNTIPDWIIYHLNKFGNCACGRDIVKKIGREEIIKLLNSFGYNCNLRVVSESRYIKPDKRIKYPLNAYYILEIETPIKSYHI